MNVSVKVGRNMLYNGVAKASLLLGNLVVLSIYSHYLGSSQFGIIALMNVVTAFYWLFFLGVPQTLIKQISHHLALNEEEEVQRVFANGALVILALGSFICIVLIFLAPVVLGTVSGLNRENENLAFVAYVTIGTTFLYTLYTPIDSALQGYQRYGTIAIRTLISTVIGWLLMVIAVWFDTGIRGIALATLGQPLGMLITNYLSFNKLRLPFKPIRYFSLKIVRYQFAFGFPLFTNDALATLRTRGDIFIVGLFWAAQYVSYYSASVTLALYALLVPRLFVGSLLVSMSELNAQGDYDRIISGCYKATRYMMLIVTPIVVALMVFSQALLSTLFPADFGQAWPVLCLLAVAYWTEAVSYPCTAVLIGVNAPRQLTVNTGITLVVLLALLFALVPPFGIIGAGVANLILLPSHLILYAQVSRTMNRRFRPTTVLQVFPLKTTFTALIASGLAAGAAWLGWQVLQPVFTALLPALPPKLVFLVAGGIIGGPVYLASLAFLVRELGPEDWKLINRVGNLQKILGRFSRKSTSNTSLELELKSSAAQASLADAKATTLPLKSRLIEPEAASENSLPVNAWADARSALHASLEASMHSQLSAVDQVLVELKRRVEEDARQVLLPLRAERESLQHELEDLRGQQGQLQDQINGMQAKFQEVSNQKQVAERQVQDILRLSQVERVRVQREISHLTSQMDTVGQEMQEFLQQQFSRIWEDFAEALPNKGQPSVGPILIPGDDKLRRA